MLKNKLSETHMVAKGSLFPCRGPAFGQTDIMIHHVHPYLPVKVAHPMISLQKGPDRVRLPGFVISGFQGLLPAFSSLSGGYDVPFSSDDHVFVAGNGRVYEI